MAEYTAIIVHLHYQQLTNNKRLALLSCCSAVLLAKTSIKTLHLVLSKTLTRTVGPLRSQKGLGQIQIKK